MAGPAAWLFLWLFRVLCGSFIYPFFFAHPLRLCPALSSRKREPGTALHPALLRLWRIVFAGCVMKFWTRLRPRPLARENSAKEEWFLHLSSLPFYGRGTRSASDTRHLALARLRNRRVQAVRVRPAGRFLRPALSAKALRERRVQEAKDA